MTIAPAADGGDRFVTGDVSSPIVPWRPTCPAPQSAAYRAAVDAYLQREETKVRAYQEAQ